jgi:hypothetical protein
MPVPVFTCAGGTSSILNQGLGIHHSINASKNIWKPLKEE